MTDEDTDNNLEDGEGDALAGLQPPVLASLTQTRDLGRDLCYSWALVSGEQLLETGPENDR